jgi:DNA-binding response OmpR family regulator
VTADVAPTRRVLVVDDDPLILEVLRTILDLEDVHVTTAGDGESALDLLADGPLPDVVVCDVTMPGISGLEVCRRLKAGTRTADVPVILLTARDRDEDRRAGRDAGCDDYLTKPFSPLALIERIVAITDGTARLAPNGGRDGR